MLRSREEIENKIVELRKSFSLLSNRVYYLQIFISFIAISLVTLAVIIFGSLVLMGELYDTTNSLLPGGVALVSALFGFVLLSWVSRKSRLRVHRRYLILTLGDALKILEEPDGEDKMFELLDEIIVERNTLKKAIFFKSDKWRRLDACVQALTWVASPGGVPGAKEE